MDRSLAFAAWLGKEAGEALRRVTPVSGTARPGEEADLLGKATPLSQSPHRYGRKKARPRPYPGGTERDST